MAKKTLALSPCTLEVLILAKLYRKALHGYLIARRIYRESGNVFHNRRRIALYGPATATHRRKGFSRLGEILAKSQKCASTL